MGLNAKSFFQIRPDDLHIASVPDLWKNSQQLDILDGNYTMYKVKQLKF
jgi:hypothetical protein